MRTRELEFNNQELLDRMNFYKDEFYRLREEHGTERGISASRDNSFSNQGLPNDYFTSDNEYMLEMTSRNRKEHEGFPEEYNSINIPQLAKKEAADGRHAWMDYLHKVKNDTAARLGAHTSALALFYPPEGFVGWHTNWNVPSYQLLFTWSETGDGYFRYFDQNTKEVVTLWDKPGWNVRYHYFGSPRESERYLWHCAYTKCDRFSFAYKWAANIGWHGSELEREMFMDAVDEVKTR